MSDDPAEHPDRTLARNTTVISVLTFVSRILGMLRESVAAGSFGAAGWSLFTVAFTIPNLFRKLLGEGAISSAFIPMYTRALREDPPGSGGKPSTDFANASVNLQLLILLAITILGELVLAGLYLVLSRPDHLMLVKLTAVMLPYVMLVCATGFLGGILQVHGRFGLVAASSIILNAMLIAAMGVAAWQLDLGSTSGQHRGAMLLALSVLAAGVLQLAVLIPSLRACGFRFRPVLYVLTPQVRAMLRLTAPVALAAGVLQLGVLLDKGLAFFLAAGPDGVGTIPLTTLALPLVEGAAARLTWAQFLYQFPLGVFAIALATAIFPRLSRQALTGDLADFRAELRRGISSALFLGLPATVGMILVAEPATNLLFRHGNFTAEDARWVTHSAIVYSAGIWAFSLLQILNRAFYALHDARTPLLWSLANLGINLVVELPLIFTPLREVGIAVGTLASFSVQAVAMTWLLRRRLGGIGLRAELRPLAVMLGAALLMGLACWVLTRLPFYPVGVDKASAAMQTAMLIVVGVLAYGGFCLAGGVDALALVRRRRRTPQPPPANPPG